MHTNMYIKTFHKTNSNKFRNQVSGTAFQNFISKMCMFLCACKQLSLMMALSTYNLPPNVNALDCLNLPSSMPCCIHPIHFFSRIVTILIPQCDVVQSCRPIHADVDVFYSEQGICLQVRWNLVISEMLLHLWYKPSHPLPTCTIGSILCNTPWW